MKPFLFALLALAVLVCSGCKCDDPSNPECPGYCNDPGDPRCHNYDPCYGKVPVSAEFVIYEIIAGKQTPTDTVLPSNVRFAGPQGMTHYEWHIGTDPRIWTERDVYLSFALEDSNSVLPVTLIVTGPPDSQCFPTDDGRDTFRRNLVVLPYCESRILGKYRGVIARYPLDTFHIEVTCEYDFTGASYFNLWGIPKTCTDTPHVNSMSTLGGFYTLRAVATFKAFCNFIDGTARLTTHDRDSIHFHFVMSSSSSIPTDLFRGKKIH